MGFGVNTPVYIDEEWYNSSHDIKLKKFTGHISGSKSSPEGDVYYVALDGVSENVEVPVEHVHLRNE